MIAKIRCIRERKCESSMWKNRKSKNTAGEEKIKVIFQDISDDTEI